MFIYCETLSFKQSLVFNPNMMKQIICSCSGALSLLLPHGSWVPEAQLTGEGLGDWRSLVSNPLA